LIGEADNYVDIAAGAIAATCQALQLEILNSTNNIYLTQRFGLGRTSEPTTFTPYILERKMVRLVAFIGHSAAQAAEKLRQSL